MSSSTPYRSLEPLAAPGRRSTACRLLAVLPLLLAAAGGGAAAQRGPGDLLVAPTRVVFEGRQRSAEITLVNTGTSAATYRISFVQLRMGEAGGTREIESGDALPGERFADSLIRYSPRQVTLLPNGTQTVRMLLRKPEGLEAGEYRSHLLFRAVPPTAPAVADETKGFRVELNPVYGVSIPVIVRHGDTSAEVALAGLELAPAGDGEPSPSLRFRIERSGNQSVYGDLTATFLPAGGGKPLEVGRANGVAVYTPNGVRRAVLPLRLPPGGGLGKGRLLLSYSRQGPQHETIAEAELVVP